MKRKSNLLVPSTANILNFCRIPIRITSLKNKTHFTEWSSFHYYLNYLVKCRLIIIKEEGMYKEISITEKGRSLLRVWIEINSMLGVKIDAYIYK